MARSQRTVVASPTPFVPPGLPIEYAQLDSQQYPPCSLWWDRSRNWISRLIKWIEVAELAYEEDTEGQLRTR
ncbi:unnamed protein product [Rhizoctonia solani]|uniref:Uncharacterized protein n=1 Tax=Rhizoctonia solani TaxID=456999 RepID=A0A8H3DIE4_9AGAM|nr:unnamed protein product [Rhizoctonia solani]